jgi:hypothetical protein
MLFDLYMSVDPPEYEMGLASTCSATIKAHKMVVNLCIPTGGILSQFTS